MCLARVYECNQEGVTCSEPILFDVARIEVVNDGLLARDMLGKSIRIRDSIRSVDFVEGTVILQRAETRETGHAAAGC